MKPLPSPPGRSITLQKATWNTSMILAEVMLHNESLQTSIAYKDTPFFCTLQSAGWLGAGYGALLQAGID